MLLALPNNHAICIWMAVCVSGGCVEDGKQPFGARGPLKFTLCFTVDGFRCHLSLRVCPPYIYLRQECHCSQVS